MTDVPPRWPNPRRAGRAACVRSQSVLRLSGQRLVGSRSWSGPESAGLGDYGRLVRARHRPATSLVFRSISDRATQPGVRRHAGGRGGHAEDCGGRARFWRSAFATRDGELAFATADIPQARATAPFSTRAQDGVPQAARGRHGRSTRLASHRGRKRRGDCLCAQISTYRRSGERDESRLYAALALAASRSASDFSPRGGVYHAAAKLAGEFAARRHRREHTTAAPTARSSTGRTAGGSPTSTRCSRELRDGTQIRPTASTSNGRRTCCAIAARGIAGRAGDDRLQPRALYPQSRRWRDQAADPRRAASSPRWSR